MLLHKSNINMAIANVLLLRKSRYDLPKAKYQKFGLPKNQKRAWLILRGPPLSWALNFFLVILDTQ